MPADNEATTAPHQDSRYQRAPKHDPTALVDVHPPSPSRTLPKNLICQAISLCCFPCPRKPHRRIQPDPTSRPSSPLPPLSVEPVFSPPFNPGRRLGNRSTYTSFPAPVFRHNGQPRALDSRLHPTTAFPSDYAVLRRRSRRSREVRHREESREHDPKPSIAAKEQEEEPTFQTPTLSCPCKPLSHLPLTSPPLLL